MAVLVVVVPVHLCPLQLQRLCHLEAMVAVAHVGEDSMVARSLPISVREVESSFDSVNSPSFPKGQRLMKMRYNRVPQIVTLSCQGTIGEWPTHPFVLCLMGDRSIKETKKEEAIMSLLRCQQQCCCDYGSDKLIRFVRIRTRSTRLGRHRQTR